LILAKEKFSLTPAFYVIFFTLNLTYLTFPPIFTANFFTLMKKHPYQSLSMRERQIMDALHAMGQGSVSDVLDRIPNPTSYNSVRILMNILEKKGFLRHYKEKNKYIYQPTLQQEEAKKSAIDHLLTTHFDKSVPQVVSALLSHKRLSEEELDQLSQMIEQAKTSTLFWLFFPT